MTTQAMEIGQLARGFSLFGMLSHGERNKTSRSTDVVGVLSDAWTAVDVDAFLTGPSVLDAQAADRFRAVMAGPVPHLAEPPLPLA